MDELIKSKQKIEEMIDKSNFNDGLDTLSEIVFYLNDHPELIEEFQNDESLSI